ncbi:hypothetical protein SLEP1_g43706 [Rubroshorea leprosula]|uniref:Uncharacterized protein n=1 Tax=Rubroshorea leprosula TaxID=152421 RepID=A0AAV5LDW2_9ROSI|nr:hypothetical protein SLEP1_g43706 [Rubroshorea leprosula]
MVPCVIVSSKDVILCLGSNLFCVEAYSFGCMMKRDSKLFSSSPLPSTSEIISNS